MTHSKSELATRLWDRVREVQDKPFWIGRGGSRSYGELVERVRRITAWLGEIGLTPGERIVIATRSDYDGFTIWLASFLNGIVPINLAPDAGSARMTGIVALAEPRILVTDPPCVAEMGATQTGVLVVSMPETLAAWHWQSEPSLTEPETTIAYLLFTSGTTNTPKGVAISHGNLSAQLATISRVFRVHQESRIFNGLVLHHVDGLVQGPVLCAAAGATLIRPEPFSPARIETDLTWLAEQGATHMVGAPAQFDMMLRGALRDDYFDRPEFVAILSSSAKLPKLLWDRLESRFSVAVINEYGMTETVAATHFAGPFPEMGSRYTIGKPIDCEAKIVGRDGHNVPIGTAGELLVRGSNVFEGYLHDSGGTERAFHEDWFRTGDLARENPDGDHEIVGRLNAAINFGGFLIVPEEIDEAICTHPGVRVSQTIGIEDEVFGQVPFSAYVADRAVQPREIIATCRARLEARKMPKRVFQVDELPRTGSGKPDMAAIKKVLLASAAECSDGGSVQDIVLSVAGDVFGVPIECLSPGSTAETTKGWDSYAQTTLALEIEQTFDIELEVARILEVESLADLIRAVENAKQSEFLGETRRLRSIRDGQGHGTIVVLPHLEGRSEYIRHVLAAFDPAIGVSTVTVEPKAATNSDKPSIRDLALDFSAEITAAGLPRPLILLGHSFAGFLAYEIATVLESKEQPADGVVLLDTAVPWKHRPYRRLNRLRMNVRGIGRLLSRSLNEPTGELLWEPGFFRLDLGQYPAHLHDMVRSWYRAMTSYRPSMGQTPLLLIAAHRRWDRALSLGRSHGWSHFSSGPVQVIRLGNGHLSLIRNQETAAKVAKEIERFARRRTALGH